MVERLLPEVDFDSLLEESNSEPEFGNKTPLFDFEKREFVMDERGRVVTDDGLKGMETIVAKAHLTARNVYVMYSDSYGSEEKDVLAADYPDKIRRMLVKEAIRDCLKWDDRVIDISPIELTNVKDGYIARYTITTIFGELEIEREVTQ